MKIILSRKGFDSSAGKIPNAILPDGSLLSFPIPAKNDNLTFDDLQYDGVAYSDILKQLRGKETKENHFNCHLDPDIRENARKLVIPEWEAAFGQINQAQSFLKNKNVKEGDLFLFFGWFKQTEGDLRDGTLRFIKGAPNLHIIYGYLQIGEMISDSEVLEEKYPWHPHSLSHRARNKTNMLYLPTKYLSFKQSKKGFGLFDFSEKRVMTMPGKTRGTWKEAPALFPQNVEGDSKNSAKADGIYYAGQWQEKVLLENKVSEKWAKELF